MGSIQREELVDQAIQKLLSEIERLEKLEPPLTTPLHDEDKSQRHLLYTNLLNELESLKQDGMHMQPKASSDEDREVRPESENNPKPSDKDGKDGHCPGSGRSNEAVGVEEIVEELRVVKRQNLVTHCLLSVLIVLTVTFQLSEVSLIMKIKDGLSHPFRFLGDILFGNVGGLGSANPQDAEKQQSSGKQPQLPLSEVVPSVPLKIPDLPHVDFGLNGKNGGS